jgi:predicted PurR-regulated permease PerM
MSRRSARTHRNEAVQGQGGSLETMVVVVAVAAALYLGRAIPIAIALLISFLLGPAVTWLRRRRVGRVPSVVIAVAPAICALVAFAYLVVTEVGRLAENIPSYQANIEGKIANAKESLPSPALLQRGSAFLKTLRNGGFSAQFPPPAQPEPPPQSAPARQQSRSHGNSSQQQPQTQPQAPTQTPPADAKPIPVQIENPEPGPLDLVRTVLGPLVDPISDAGLVLLFVIFFLAERETLRDRIIRLAGPRDLHRTTMAMDEAGNRLSRYLLLQTVVNTLYGSIIAIALTILGIPNAALWGAIAGLLRFIPYVGVAAAAVLPIALAFAVDPGWSLMFWTAGIFLGLELVVGNVLEPWLYGASTGLSAVALVVSAIFWTWLWGTIGLLLATPLTVCIAVIGRHVPQLAFLDVLLGNQAPLKPEESFYQRLLAGNAIEAAIQGEEWLKSKSLVEFLDQVALPALILAERDRSRGELEEEHLKQVADGIRTVISALLTEIAKSARGHARPDPAPAEEERAPGMTLCVAGQSDLDEAAALLVASALGAIGRQATVLPRDSAVRLALPPSDQTGMHAVCLSFLSADSLPNARYLTRRFRRRIGTDIPIIVAFWGADQSPGRLLHVRAETRADRVVGSVQAALDAIDNTADADGEGGIEPELNALAVRVSEVIRTRAEPVAGA